MFLIRQIQVPVAQRNHSPSTWRKAARVPLEVGRTTPLRDRVERSRKVAVTSIRKRAEVGGYVGKSVSGSWKRDAQSSRNPWNEFQDLSWKLDAMILRTRYTIELVRDRRPEILIFLAGAKRNHPVKSTRHDRFMRKVLIVLRKRKELSP